MGRRKSSNTKDGEIPLLESISAGIGLAILSAIVGFLIYEALMRSDGTPPLLVVEPVGLAAAPGQFIVEVEVSNRSRHTGAGVEIEGSLSRGGSAVETSTASVAYVPGLSRRRAGLIFTQDPRQSQLQLRVTGYERP